MRARQVIASGSSVEVIERFNHHPTEKLVLALMNSKFDRIANWQPEAF